MTTASFHVLHTAGGMLDVLELCPKNWKIIKWKLANFPKRNKSMSDHVGENSAERACLHFLGLCNVT